MELGYLILAVILGFGVSRWLRARRVRPSTGDAGRAARLLTAISTVVAVVWVLAMSRSPLGVVAAAVVLGVVLYARSRLSLEP